jgi:hypothetical protein
MKIPEADYASALAKAKAEITELRTERARLDTRIAGLEHTVRALGALLNEPAAMPRLGLTAGIKAALKDVEGSGLYPTTVRTRLLEAGVVLPARNPMASVHAVLKRLAADGYAEAQVIDGKRAYFWVADRPKR